MVRRAAEAIAKRECHQQASDPIHKGAPARRRLTLDSPRSPASHSGTESSLAGRLLNQRRGAPGRQPTAQQQEPEPALSGPGRNALMNSAILQDLAALSQDL